MGTNARPGFEERAHQALSLGYERTLVIELGYRGAGFKGYAYQPGLRTVEGELSEALSKLLKREPETSCAGRTDSGVHALAQHMSVPLFPGELDLSAQRIRTALDAMCGEDISIKRVLGAPAGFSARFDALSRSYRYRICDGPARPVLGAEHSWWLGRPLDEEAMDRAAQPLLGEHDFKSFAKAASVEGKSTVREILQIGVDRGSEAGEELVMLNITATAFLHSMVRTIVGTLAEVGLGRAMQEWPAQVMEACNRSAAGRSAPAQGLTLTAVAYPEGVLCEWDEKRL